MIHIPRGQVERICPLGFFIVRGIFLKVDWITIRYSQNECTAG